MDKFILIPNQLKMSMFLEMQKSWSDVILTGSLALMLWEIIPETEANDLDVVIKTESRNEFSKVFNLVANTTNDSEYATNCIGTVSFSCGQCHVLTRPYIVSNYLEPHQSFSGSYCTRYYNDECYLLSKPLPIIEAKLQYLANNGDVKHAQPIIKYVEWLTKGVVTR